MPNAVLASVAASITELKRDPMGTVAAGQGASVVILNRNAPAFYCVPAGVYEAMIERLEDTELMAIAEARKGEAVIKVSLDDL
jgi:antitoxin StbD